jgi:hypothetical protein
MVKLINNLFRFILRQNSAKETTYKYRDKDNVSRSLQLFNCYVPKDEGLCAEQ